MKNKFNVILTVTAFVDDKEVDSIVFRRRYRTLNGLGIKLAIGVVVPGVVWESSLPDGVNRFVYEQTVTGHSYTRLDSRKTADGWKDTIDQKIFGED